VLWFVSGSETRCSVPGGIPTPGLSFFRSKPFRDDSGTILGLVCPKVACHPLVFVANVPGVAFEEVQRRSIKGSLGSTPKQLGRSPGVVWQDVGYHGVGDVRVLDSSR